MKAVMISIRPEWVRLIVNEYKTVEIRKNAPNLETPFRCYIYCTKADPNNPHERLELHTTDGKIRLMNGKVIGEFVCDSVEEISKENKKNISDLSCVPLPKMYEYAGPKGLYSLKGWHISDLVVYDDPKDLSEFWQTGNDEEDYCIACPHHETPEGEEPCKSCDGNRKYLHRAPQSWCYVEQNGS